MITTPANLLKKKNTVLRFRYLLFFFGCFMHIHCREDFNCFVLTITVSNNHKDTGNERDNLLSWWTLYLQESDELLVILAVVLTDAARYDGDCNIT